MKISVQLYSLRDAGDLDRQLALAREAGFDSVESVATHGLSAADFARTLARHGLRHASMHASLQWLEADPDAVSEACTATGCPLVVMPFLPMGVRPASAAGWRAMGERLARCAARLAPAGLQLAYHNHDFEFLAYEGRPALDWLFDAAPPAVLGWEADLGWVARAGQDPWHWIARHHDRLLAVHAKDIAPEGSRVDEDGWAPLGAGVLPWERLLPALAASTDLVIYEHDRPGDPAAVLAASRAHLRAHLG